MFLATVVAGGDETTNRLHLGSSLLLDSYLLWAMVWGGAWRGKAALHQAPWIPTRIQTALTATEAVLLCYDWGKGR